MAWGVFPKTRKLGQVRARGLLRAKESKERQEWMHILAASFLESDIRWELVRTAKM
jgi:hypothetical protein